MPGAAKRISSTATDLVTGEHTWSGRPGLILIRPRTRTAPAERARRLLNVSIAAISLLLLLPVMLVIALAIKLSSRGPVLYSQKRVGIDRRRGSGGNWRRTVDYGGRLFTIYKFRTMQVEQMESEQWAQPGDSRVTRVGRFLRTYRLDELPQLINVLKGEMNIVGPRPEQPRIFLELRDVIDQYHERQRVLPGITGWAQINQSYDQTIDDVRRKIEYDLDYVRNATAGRDIEIMLRTVPVVLFGKGGW